MLGITRGSSSEGSPISSSSPNTSPNLPLYRLNVSDKGYLKKREGRRKTERRGKRRRKRERRRERERKRKKGRRKRKKGRGIGRPRGRCIVEHVLVFILQRRPNFRSTLSSSPLPQLQSRHRKLDVVSNVFSAASPEFRFQICLGAPKSSRDLQPPRLPKLVY